MRATISEAAETALKNALARAGIERSQIRAVLATGYGRDQVSFADLRMTELSCHARGCHHYFPEPIIVVDIGGQDSKIMRLSAEGKRLKHRMNRKCAAGTGSFLEDIARRLNLPLAELDGRSTAHFDPGEVGVPISFYVDVDILHEVGFL